MKKIFNIFDDFNESQVLNEKIPIVKLLENSCYYPSCGTEGQIIKYLSKDIQSFIYCDYGISKEEFLLDINSFYGYKVFTCRYIEKDELIPQGWNQKLPPDFNISDYYKNNNYIKRPFAYWVIYERLNDFEDNHGPNRFSLLYIGGEGVTTYQALYYSRKLTAKVLAIIQPGTGFGFNWTDFSDKKGSLAWVVLKNPYGTPDLIYYGGSGHFYNDLNWDNYKLKGKIKPYYSNTNSEATIWERM